VTVGEGSRATGDEPDLAGVRAMGSGPDFDCRFDDSKRSSRSFDRTSLVYSIWFPDDAGPASRKTHWPNSPPPPGF